MDQTTTGLIGLLITLIVTGVMLRRRYGNLYSRASDAFERATGLSMTVVVRGLGILTLVGWAVVYLLIHDGSEIDLEEIWPSFGKSLSESLSTADPLAEDGSGSSAPENNGTEP